MISDKWEKCYIFATKFGNANKAHEENDNSNEDCTIYHPIFNLLVVHAAVCAA